MAIWLENPLRRDLVRGTQAAREGVCAWAVEPTAAAANVGIPDLWVAWDGMVCAIECKIVGDMSEKRTNPQRLLRESQKRFVHKLRLGGVPCFLLCALRESDVLFWRLSPLFVRPSTLSLVVDRESDRGAMRAFVLHEARTFAEGSYDLLPAIVRSLAMEGRHLEGESGEQEPQED